MGNSGGEFAVAEGGDDGEQGSEDPADEEEAGGFHLTSDVGTDDENAGADHGADDEGGGVSEAETADKAVMLFLLRCR